MGSQTTQTSGTGQYVGPDTSNALYQQLQAGGTYDPAAAASQGYNSYMQGLGVLGQGITGQVSGLQDVAQTTAENAYSQYGVDSRALAQQQARSAQENVASQYAGSGALNSGAALRSIAAGTAEPLLNAETQLSQLYGNTYSQTANNLYGQAYNNLGQQASMYGQLGSQQYGQAANQLSLLGQLGSSSYIAPQYQQQSGLFGTILGGAASGLGAGLGTALGGLFG